jgi:hypothetical protein
MSQHFVKWEPVQGLPTPLYCEALHDDWEGFRVLLRGEDPRSRLLRITFPSPASYRNTNESYLLRTWSEARDRPLCSLLNVLNSEWLAWLRAENGPVVEGRSFVHYAILTPEDCIEVLSEHPPSVEWL